MQTENSAGSGQDQATRSEERRVFLFLAVMLAPILSFVLVGGYGFILWMSQLLLGPPSS